MLVGLIVGSAGVGVGVAVTRVGPPASLADAAPAQVIRVETEPFADLRSVQIVLTQQPGLDLVTHAAGTVTHSTCSPGARVRSGTSPWSVDSRPLLTLATTVPLYRDLTEGDHGEDVAGLQTELRRLGYHAPSNGIFDVTTLSALDALRARLDIPSSQGLDHTTVVWLPAPSVQLAQCQTATGTEIEAGNPMATTSARVITAAVDPIPRDLLPGARVVVVEGARVRVGPSGVISDQKALHVMLSTSIGRVVVGALGSAQPVPFEATLALARPIATVTVPASAVVTTNGTCVLDSGGMLVRADVVSSTLGRSIVKFATGDAPSSVVIAPPGSTSCA